MMELHIRDLTLEPGYTFKRPVQLLIDLLRLLEVLGLLRWVRWSAVGDGLGVMFPGF